MGTIVRPAAEADMPAIMELLVLLAEFDGSRDSFVATEEQLQQAFFSAAPTTRVLLAVLDGRAIGLATYYRTFSTFLAKPGIWLDDLFVKEPYRTRGVGRALLAELARIARGLGCCRIDWIVALSNARGIAFYERLGARVNHKSRCVRLDDEGIDQLAEDAALDRTGTSQDAVAAQKTVTDHEAVGRYWDANADVWTQLARSGHDVYRDHLNSPAFFAALPDVQGRRGLDIGCGEGHNTRCLAERGAKITAVDISERFIAHARRAEAEEPRGIDYRVASAVALPFDDCTFDFVTGFMSFMDIAETDRVLSEAFRVL